MRRGYPSDFDQQVALGLVPGVQQFRKWGINSSIDNSPASTPEDIWGGAGVYAGQPTSTTPVQFGVVSASAADAVGSSGALTLTIEGLLTSSSSLYSQETINLSGTSNVLTTNSWYRINRAFVATAGSVGFNVGAITITGQAAGSNVYATIPANVGQTVLGCFTVPFGRKLILGTGRLSLVRANGALGSATFAFQTRGFGTGSWRAQAYEFISTTGPIYLQDAEPIVIPALTDVRPRIFAVSDNGSQISIAVAGYLIDSNMTDIM